MFLSTVFVIFTIIPFYIFSVLFNYFINFLKSFETFFPSKSLYAFAHLKIIFIYMTFQLQQFFSIKHKNISLLFIFLLLCSQIFNSSYYWGVMDRYEAEKLLENKPGLFIIIVIRLALSNKWHQCKMLIYNTNYFGSKIHFDLTKKNFP